jgi:ribosomal subunit interface protein
MKVRYLTRGLELTAELEKYANGKTARLARKVPRRLKAGTTCEVVFSQIIHKDDKVSTCSITLSLGEKEIKAKETTQHIYAALDIAVVDIEQQLKGYARGRRWRILHRPRVPKQ